MSVAATPTATRAPSSGPTCRAASFQSRGPNQFLIRAAGGVGIGTNDPDEQLHVAGNTKVDGSITSGNSITIDGTANTINSSGNLDLQTGGISRIYVDNTTGNVRIGSLLYGGKLTVLGDVHATSQITRDYGDGNDNPAAPLAYGFVPLARRHRFNHAQTRRSGGTPRSSTTRSRLPARPTPATTTRRW